MFNSRSVLLLGAGASRPFGYPLGSELIDSIADGILRAINEEIPSISIWKQGLGVFLDQPYSTLITYVEHFQRSSPSRTQFEELAKKLKRATHQSIDDFARTNGSFRQLVKALVALEIARVTYDNNLFRANQPSVNQSLFGRSRDNWYSRLVSKITENCDSVEHCYERNFLSVVTFNYDRSLEHYLDMHLGSSEMFSGIKASELVRPIHVHGSLDFKLTSGRLLDEQLGEQIMQCHGAFSIMGEPRNAQNDPVQVARSMFHQAERIYALGFDFHQSNVDLLQLKEIGVVRKVIALNFDGSARFDNKARAAGVADENIWRPRSGETYSIARAIEDGLFETAPKQ